MSAHNPQIPQMWSSAEKSGGNPRLKEVLEAAARDHKDTDVAHSAASK